MHKSSVCFEIQRRNNKSTITISLWAAVISLKQLNKNSNLGRHLLSSFNSCLKVPSLYLSVLSGSTVVTTVLTNLAMHTAPTMIVSLYLVASETSIFTWFDSVRDGCLVFSNQLN